MELQENQNKIRRGKDKMYYTMYNASPNGRLKNSQWHKSHRELINKAVRKYQEKCRSIMMWYLGYRCAHCGYSEDSRALQFDHIKGDGALDRKLHGAGSAMTKHYYKNPEIVMNKFQILCANCNWIKKAVYHERLGANLVL